LLSENIRRNKKLFILIFYDMDNSRLEVKKQWINNKGLHQPKKNTKQETESKQDT